MTAIPTAPTPTPERSEPDRPSPARPSHKGRIGLVVAGSLATGLLAALVLVVAPFVPAEESGLIGAVLLGFALGWAMLAVLSARRTDQPQRWAFAPALFMGLGGLLLVVLGSDVHEALQWVWPPALLALSVWMATRARRQLRSRSRWVLIYPVIAVLVLCSLGGGYQMVRQTMADSAPGRLVDVGRHLLHLHCTGSGSPTVVIEPGAGMKSSDAAPIASTVAESTRVCVYDRAGRGWSEPADNRQDGARVAADLHALLDQADVPGPYVLAGHSFGGLYVATYAERYPDEVAGMVLIDSTAPAEEAEAPASDQQGAYDAVGRIVTVLSSLASVVTAPVVGSTMNEYGQGSRSTKQAAALTDLGDTPLVVLTAGVGSDAGWMDDQRAMAALSTNSVQRVVDGATHAGLLLEEEPAAASAQAIIDVVTAVRDGDPLG